MDGGTVRRGIGSVQLLVALAAEHGLPAGACLRGSGIRLADLRDAFAEIDAEQELAVVRNLVRHLGHVPALGLEAGSRYRLTAYGIWGYALLSSRTLRSATEFGLRYLDLTFAFARFRAERANGDLRLVLEDDAIPADCRQFLIERDAAAAVALQRDLFQRPVPLRRACFRFHRPAYGDRFADFFPGPVQFDAPFHGIAIAARWADQPLPQSDERTARLCEEQCRELLGRRRACTPLAERVRQHLLRPQGGASMEETAADLGMAVRTLHRRLAGEGTTFRALVGEVRRALADEMLLQRMSVDDVAERLGYAEASSFVHAFKRWTGVAPGAYRDRHARSRPAGTRRRRSARRPAPRTAPRD